MVAVQLAAVMLGGAGGWWLARRYRGLPVVPRDRGELLRHVLATAILLLAVVGVIVAMLPVLE